VAAVLKPEFATTLRLRMAASLAKALSSKRATAKPVQNLEVEAQAQEDQAAVEAQAAQAQEDLAAAEAQEDLAVGAQAQEDPAVEDDFRQKSFSLQVDMDMILVFFCFAVGSL